MPSDATLAVVFFSGLSDTTGDFDSSSISLSLGGTSLTYISRSPTTASCDIAALYVSSPATGSQTFSWSVQAGVTYGNLFVLVFYKNTNTSTPVADYDSVESVSGTLQVSGLTSSSGQMTVCAAIAHTPCEPVLSGDSQTQITLTGWDAKQASVHTAVGEKANATSIAATFTGGTNHYGSLVALVIDQTPETGTLAQHSFRFFNDDGSESASTAKAALNTNVNLAANDVARIRFLIDATGDAAGKKFQLEYRKKPSGGSFGPWTEVN